MTAQQFKAFRARMGWSQEETARELATPVGTIRNWEQERMGRRDIPRAIVRLIELIDDARAGIS